MASITLPRPSQKGNLANVIKHKPAKHKGCQQRAKGKEEGAVSTEASTWRDLEFGGSRLEGMVGSAAAKHALQQPIETRNNYCL